MISQHLAMMLLVISSNTLGSGAVKTDEISVAHRWVMAKFEGKSPAASPQGGPEAAILANTGRVQKKVRLGQPLRLGGKEFRRGLACHGASKMTVRLPAPARVFSAVVGVDSNERTRVGQGSVVFLVRVGGKELFRSSVMNEGVTPVSVSVDLAGAVEFVLETGDAGNGPVADEADWADAQVKLVDGRTIWLDDLPVAERSSLNNFDTEPPFSFTYGGQPSSLVLRTWELRRTERTLDNRGTERTLRYVDPRTGLAVRCVVVDYRDFPVVEWTLYFKNEGNRDTPVLEGIQALDTRFERGIQEEFLLHHAVGSPARPNDYQPLQTKLDPRSVTRVATSGGRPSNSDLPYFNLNWGGEGVIFAVGWIGQWSTRFDRDPQRGIRVRAGQELTHFRLRPGEEVRSPLIALQFWKGDWIDAQNTWRRWMIAHNLPRPGGRQVLPHLAANTSRQFNEMENANEENQKFFIDRYLEEGFKLDYWWMDAGWYPNKTGWPNTGTWEPDLKRFPGGLRAISDHAHAKGVKIIVWFEPERVTPGTWLWENHPEWLLSIPGGRQKLLDLGNPQAREWLIDHIDKLLTEQGIDLYRQDFNMDPLEYWRANDAEDRQGITEIRHVTGLLAYWDELRRRYPNLLIDTCASGGRRNDLETLRRAVPFHRSDYVLEPVGQQAHTYGIAFWMPFFGTRTDPERPYVFRSDIAPHTRLGLDWRRKDVNSALARRMIAQWREIAPYYLGDYYPLTPYSLASDIWMAWQFHRPDLGEGMVQAFRRMESPYEEARFKLRGLDRQAIYELIDLDAPGERRQSGQELMEGGLRAAVTDRPGAVIIKYRKAANR